MVNRNTSIDFIRNVKVMSAVSLQVLDCLDHIAQVVELGHLAKAAAHKNSLDISFSNKSIHPFQFYHFIAQMLCLLHLMYNLGMLYSYISK